MNAARYVIVPVVVVACIEVHIVVVGFEANANNWEVQVYSRTCEKTQTTLIVDSRVIVGEKKCIGEPPSNIGMKKSLNLA
jgi:hypothetical protein